jgi:5-methylcytosine-specific restriction endonuclease McrA
MAKPRAGRGRSLIGTWQWHRKGGIRERIIRRDRSTCQSCGVVTLRGDVDHILPRALGGTDHPSNLRYLCKPCHRAKTTGKPRHESVAATRSSGLPTVRGTLTRKVP